MTNHSISTVFLWLIDNQVFFISYLFCEKIMGATVVLHSSYFEIFDIPEAISPSFPPKPLLGHKKTRPY